MEHFPALSMKSASSFVLVQNKTYRLWQRSPSPTSPWWLRLQIHGVRTAISTKTSDLPTAQHRATGFIEAALQGDLSVISAQTTPTTTKAATIGEIIASLNASKIPSAPRYTAALISLISKAKAIPPAKVSQQSSRILTPQLIHVFHLNATPDQYGSLNAILINAQSCFSKTALTHFEKLSLPLPDLTPFLSTPLLPDTSFRYSDSPLTPKHLKALQSLDIPPDLQSLHALIALAGLTPSEASTATPKDFTPGGKFFSRSPLPPSISLPRRGPLIPHKNEAHRLSILQQYNTLLSSINLTPQHLRFHAAHTWLQRSGHLPSAAQFLGCSTQWASFHLSTLPSIPQSLSWDELYGKENTPPRRISQGIPSNEKKSGSVPP